MLSPAVVNKMRHDFNQLIYGLDGCDCLISWSNPDVGAVIDPVYNEISGAVVTGSQMIRCHVNKVFGESEIKHKALVDVMSGDAIMLFDKSVNFQGLGNLTFTVQNMGQWKLEEQPPNVFQSYTRILVNGESFVQAAYMRRYSTT